MGMIWGCKAGFPSASEESVLVELVQGVFLRTQALTSAPSYSPRNWHQVGMWGAWRVSKEGERGEVFPGPSPQRLYLLWEPQLEVTTLDSCFSLSPVYCVCQ